MVLSGPERIVFNQLDSKVTETIGSGRANNNPIRSWPRFAKISLATAFCGRNGCFSARGPCVTSRQALGS